MKHCKSVGHKLWMLIFESCKRKLRPLEWLLSFHYAKQNVITARGFQCGIKSLRFIFVSVIPIFWEIGFQVDNILFINVFYLLYVAQMLMTSSVQNEILGKKKRE